MGDRGGQKFEILSWYYNKKRSQLSIRGVFVDGDWNTDPEVVKDVFKYHFATRFKQRAHGRLKLNISFPNQLSTDQVADMDRSVSRDEIRGNNSSFIALIPKVTDAKFVTDFRPISLIGCVYKVVTKILANRLATVNLDLVSDIQSAFVANRQNLDGPFILNELLAWCKRKKGAASLIGCAVMQNPFRYLGVMVGDSMSQKLAWADTVQKLRSRLSKWKVKTLSIGGRLTLLKLVLDASPLYNMSIYKVPKGILKEMEANRCNFSNGADPTEKDYLGFDFVSHCKKRVGDGHNTRFWYDSWVFDQPLRVRFPCLFALDTDKESTVASKLGSSSVRTILDDIFFPYAVDATRWVKYISIKINIFAWRARLNRLPTRSNLVRRGVVLDSSVCPLCGLVPEDIHHVFFRCDTAKLVFCRIYRWWDLDWHDLLSFSDWNASFSAIRHPSRIKLILEGVFYVAWWHLWVYRNQFIFAATPPRRLVIFDDIVSRSFTWCADVIVLFLGRVG
nr:RNA-directed DNA polymerase, eukaryota [Tanacetum cinerariifolium]